MEKQKTQADVRREEFQRHAEAARNLADLSLRDIDAVLVEEDELIAKIHLSVEQGDEEFEEAQLLWDAFRHRKED